MKHDTTIFLLSILITGTLYLGIPVYGGEGDRMVKTQIAGSAWYSERIATEVINDGYVWGNARLEGSSITLGAFDPDMIPQEIQDIFQWGDIRTSQNDFPTETNLWITLVFSTNDPSLAERYAEVIIGLIEQYTTTLDVSFDGSYGEGWDENTGQYYSTRVQYSGHIDWIHFSTILSNSIPRDIGGIASTIDAYSAESLGFNFWGDNNQISAAIDLSYWTELKNQTGGFSLSLKDIIPVDSFSPAIDSQGLYLNHVFPNVTSLSYSLTNTSTTQVKIMRAPDWMNDIKEDKWVIDAFISGGTYTDIVMWFDYEFTQWTWTNRETFNWDVDPRGYSQFRLDVWGKNRAAPTFNLLANSTLLSDVEEIWFSSDHQTSVIPGHDGIWLDVFFPVNYSTSVANTTVDAIASELSTLGYSFRSWGMNNESRWSYKLQRDVEVLRVSRYGFLNQSTLVNAIASSYVYGRSAAMQAIDLYNVQRFEWYVVKDRWGLAASMSFSYSQLHQALYNPQLFFTQGSMQTYTVDMLSAPLFNFSGTIPWGPESDIVEMRFSSPFNGSWENIRFGPWTNRGFGWNSWRWNDIWNGINRVVYNVEIWEGNPMLTDDSGNQIGPLQDINVTYSYSYMLDTDDIETPWGSLYYATGSYTGYFYDEYSDLFGGTTLNGTERIAVAGQDEAPWVWNGTAWVERFPQTGVSSVEVTMFREDAPVDHPLFNIPLTFTHMAEFDEPSRTYWGTSLDTTLYPDGNWFFDVAVVDGAGNRGWMGQNFVIDNYDETYLPSVITWSPDSPSNGSAISGIAGFDFNITDDAGTYATILWTNLGGNVITPTNVFEVNGKVVSTYHFDFDTLTQGFENQEVVITVDTLDMDGHWTTSTLKVIIDNRKFGEPPVVTVVSPDDGITVNTTENGKVLFAVNVTDDWGIASVTLSLGNDEFFMFYNDSTGLYEVEVDLSTSPPGTYFWKVTVVDVDENTHTVETARRVLNVVGTDESKVDETPPSLRLIQPNDGETVSGSVYIEVAAEDDNRVAQVSLTLPDDTVVNMVRNGTFFSYTWDSTEVADGTYTLSVRAVDDAGNDVVINFSVKVSNGRTAPPPPEFGLPGFELPVVAAAVIFLTKVKRRRRR